MKRLVAVLVLLGLALGTAVPALYAAWGTWPPPGRPALEVPDPTSAADDHASMGPVAYAPGNESTRLRPLASSSLDAAETALGASASPAADRAARPGLALTDRIRIVGDLREPTPAGRAQDVQALPYRATGLWAATLTHPLHTPADLAFVERLGPLPTDLDLALGSVVAAHGAATTHLLTSDKPQAQLIALLTTTAALDAVLPTLENYRDHPVWAQSNDNSGSAARPRVDAANLEAALLALYASLGLSPEAQTALQPLVAGSIGQLPAAYQAPLLTLLQALAAYHDAAFQVLREFRQAEQAEPGDGDAPPAEPTDAAALLAAATAQIRQAAAEATDLLQQAPAEEAAAGDVWTDPLGLIVVGTSGDDTYGPEIGPDPAVRPLINTTRAATAPALGVATTEIDAHPGAFTVPLVGTLDAGIDAAAATNASGATTGVGQPGWHLLVLDPGGNDVYRNNAGGVDPGNVAIQIHASEAGLVRSVIRNVVKNDRLCLPSATVCLLSPPASLEPLLGPIVGAATDEGADPSVTTATGVLGAAVPLAALVLDLDGDDEYNTTEPFVQGAARGIGLGLLFDLGGDDQYVADVLAQGASVDGGYAALVDAGGNDTYVARQAAQGWVRLPDTRTSSGAVGAAGFASVSELNALVHAQARGVLADLGGSDDYRLADLLTGQGVTALSESGVDGFNGFIIGPGPQRTAATLVDIGGPEHLPVPRVATRRGAEAVPPNQISVSGYEPIELWYARALNASDAGIGEIQNSRYKTALHATTSGMPDALGEDGIRIGDARVAWYDFPLAPGIVQSLLPEGSVNETTRPLLLLGQPARVEDPPLLTITFGGDTIYTGTIARARGSSLDEETEARSQEPLSLLVDLSGNDLYIGGNETIGVAFDGGVALLLDMEGSDRIVAGDWTVAVAKGPGSIAVVMDVDGVLEAATGNESQGFAAHILKAGGAIGNPHLDEPLHAQALPVAMLDLGARPSPEPNDRVRGLARETSGSSMTARNRSLGFGEGLGVGLLVGSPGADHYRVEGWGLGVHIDQQLVVSTCKDVTSPPIANGAVALAVNAINGAYKSVRPWLGGAGIVLDPSGNDRYEAGTAVALGDARGHATGCAVGLPPPARLANLPGLGLFLDARGHDTYELDNQTRPAGFAARSCGGQGAATCIPQEDQAWVVTSPDWIRSDAVVPPIDPSVVGLGVDNVRNLHHALRALCIWLDPEGGVDCGDEAEDAADLIEAPLAADRSPRIYLATARTPPTDANWDHVWRFAENAGKALNGPDFHERSGWPTCQDPQEVHGGEALTSPDGTPDVICIVVDTEFMGGQWTSDDPNGDPLDPGETVSCNCTAAIRIEPNQGATVTLDPTEMNQTLHLYPRQGTLHTITANTGPWHDNWTRLTAPLRLGPEFDEAGTDASAPFFVNLTDLPLGLANLTLEVRVRDVAAEESGGFLAETTTVVDLRFIDRRNFTRAFLVEHSPERWGVFLHAPGPVHDQTNVTVTFARALTDEEETEIKSDWTKVGRTVWRAPLPDVDPIDAPSRALTYAGPILGPRACGAMLIQDRIAVVNGAPRLAAGACWTGNDLVVGWDLGHLDPALIRNAGFAVKGQVATLPLDTYDRPDSIETPKAQVENATEETYTIKDSGAPVTVRGVPGTRQLKPGAALVENLTEAETDGMWALVRVRPDVPDAIGLVPVADPLLAGPLFDNVTVHVRFNRTATLGVTAGEGPVVRRGAVEPASNVTEVPLRCIVSDLVSKESFAAALRVDGSLVNAAGASLPDQRCLVKTDGAGLEYLIPLGVNQPGEDVGPRLLEFDVATLTQDGRAFVETLALHLDPHVTPGLLTIDRTPDRWPRVNATLAVAAAALEVGRLVDQSSDLIRVRTEARLDGGPWGPLQDWPAIPTPDSLSGDARIELGEVLQGLAAARVDLRLVLMDESGNERPTNVAVYRFDQTPPTILAAVVEPGDLEDVLVLTFDEPAKFACVDPECLVRPVTELPGVRPDAFLDLRRMIIHATGATIPVPGLLRGLAYNTTLELEDDLGNKAARDITIASMPPLRIDLAPMRGALVNRTATIQWWAATGAPAANDAVQAFTSAYLRTANGTCSLLQGYPNVVVGPEPQARSVGPLPVTCAIGPEGTDAELLVYALVPSARGLAHAAVPVFVDTHAPSIQVDSPLNWTSRAVAIQIEAHDALPLDLEVRVNGTVAATAPDRITLTLTEEGTHDLGIVAVDAAGNRATADAAVRIDRTPPHAAVAVQGRTSTLVLLQVTALDELSGIAAIQAVTASNEGPRVPVKGDGPVTLVHPLADQETAVVVMAVDRAGNEIRVPVALPQARMSAASGIQPVLRVVRPDAVRVTFTTPDVSAPVVIADAQGTHIERALPPGTDHDMILERLPPGSEVAVAVALAREGRLEPVGHATVLLPPDHEPPELLVNVTATPLEGAVLLAWDEPRDDVGIHGVAIRRQGTEVGRVQGRQFLDIVQGSNMVVYALAAVDLAGNLGPWTTVEVTPLPALRVTAAAATPAIGIAGEPVAFTVTLEHDVGAQPDIAVLQVGELVVPMTLVTRTANATTFETRMVLPPTNLTLGRPAGEVRVHAGTVVLRHAMPVPLVTDAHADPADGPSLMPWPSSLVPLALLVAAVMLRRHQRRLS